MKCARERNIEFCCECSDYPCEVLVAFNNDNYAHHSTALPNLNRILEKGLEVWLEEQRARWSCENCGNIFTWYDKKCGSCGKEVKDCKMEAIQ